MFAVRETWSLIFTCQNPSRFDARHAGLSAEKYAEKED